MSSSSTIPENIIDPILIAESCSKNDKVSPQAIKTNENTTPTTFTTRNPEGGVSFPGYVQRAVEYKELAAIIGEESDRASEGESDDDYEHVHDVDSDDAYEDDFDPDVSAEDEKPKKRKRKIAKKASPTKVQPSPPRPIKRARSDSKGLPSRAKDRIVPPSAVKAKNDYQNWRKAFGIAGDNGKTIVKKVRK